MLTLSLFTVGAIPTEPIILPGDQDLRATGSGSIDADSDPITYRYEWYRDRAGVTSRFVGRVVSADETVRGDVWYVRSRAFDGEAVSPWQTSPTYLIGNSRPTPPATVTIRKVPNYPNYIIDAQGATDPDGDVITYHYRWFFSLDGVTWRTGPAERTLANASAGYWKAAARSYDGEKTSLLAYSTVVQLPQGAP